MTIRKKTKSKARTKTAPARKAPAPKKAAAKAASPTVKNRVTGKAAAAKAPRKSAPKPKGGRVTVATATPGRTPRRAVFIDVENTSSETALFEALEALRIDRRSETVEVSAVGNWRVVGPTVGRRLASIGAHLVHSAPARGVRDWSDLWIAVAAGCWLGQASAGDSLDIISNDRAFDAVGDIAAARGIVFRRQHHKHGTTTAAAAAAASAESEEPKPKPRRRSRGGRRRGRGRSAGAASTTTSQKPLASARPAAVSHAPTPAPRVPEPQAAEVAHGASRDQILALIGKLNQGEAARWVNLDILEKALKEEGFSRPPGSPRLVTRLRMLKDVEVDSHGRVRVAGSAAPAESADLDS